MFLKLINNEIFRLSIDNYYTCPQYNVMTKSMHYPKHVLSKAIIS